MQVNRRLRAMLEHLIRELPEDRRPPLEEELALLVNAVKCGFRDEEDRKRGREWRITRGLAGRILDDGARWTNSWRACRSRGLGLRRDMHGHGGAESGHPRYCRTAAAAAGSCSSACVANFVVAPALAYTLTKVVPLDSSHTIGLLLLGGAAGAPFLPKLAEMARGDIAFSVGLMLLLMVGSVALMPVVLPLLIPGLSAGPWQLLRPLLFTMLLPLAAGLVVKNRSERWAARLRPYLRARVERKHDRGRCAPLRIELLGHARDVR